jgi:hypothetical protein
MSQMDKIRITILKDGTIKTVTDAISGPNHSSAEQFVNGVAEKLGGEMTAEKRHDADPHHFHYHDDVEHQH